MRMGANPYAITYGYDNVGNRLSQTKDGVLTNYTYNSRDQLLTENCQLTTVNYSYDHAGRMTGKTDANGTTTYSWIDSDRMAQVSGPGALVTYAYDHSGQRVSETSGAGTKKYLIDYQLPYGQVVGEMDGDGNPVITYLYGLERISQTRTQNAQLTTHNFLVDGQGSVRQLTKDKNGLRFFKFFFIRRHAAAGNNDMKVNVASMSVCTFYT
jgi:YD repeat-containing protein